MNKDSKSLSDKISELINPNPVWEDPENDYSETTAKLVGRSSEFLEDAIQKQSIHKSTLKLSKCVLLDESDKKYVGKKVSRRSYEKLSSNPYAFTNNGDASSEDENTRSKLLSEVSASEESGSDEEDSVASSSSEENAESFVGRSENERIKSISFSDEIEKANAVRSQIRLWDNLLEVRIQLQKCLVASNKLPPYYNFEAFLPGCEFRNQLSITKQEGQTLLDNLLQLQTILLHLNSETRSISSGISRKEEDGEIFNSVEKCSSLQDTNENNYILKKKRKLSDISKEITDQDVNFKRYRDDTLQKWYLRSKAASVKSSNFSAFDLSILKQIEHVLRDKESLMKRTQKKRTSYRMFGCVPNNQVGEAKVDEEFNCEIFDDDDFYHKLLQELIERKSADLADPTQLGRQWSELQKLRRKLKKKVDTKASKGRKIRYVAHTKLVNFMAPVPYGWNDSAMDDLFRSLFGKVE